MYRLERGWFEVGFLSSALAKSFRNSNNEKPMNMKKWSQTPFATLDGQQTIKEEEGQTKKGIVISNSCLNAIIKKLSFFSSFWKILFRQWFLELFFGSGCSALNIRFRFRTRVEPGPRRRRGVGGDGGPRCWRQHPCLGRGRGRASRSHHRKENLENIWFRVWVLIQIRRNQLLY